MILDQWQKEIMDRNGNILLCTGRQVGKTTIFAWKAARRMMNDKDCHVLVVSLTEDQAQLIIAMILNFIEIEGKKLICKGNKRPTKNRIILKNGSQVRARAVGITGNSVRGFTGNILIVDEASRMPEAVWTAAKPTLLTTAGEIWMCSTPFGRQGYFYECYQNTKRYNVFHISSVEVINDRPVSEGWTQKQRDAAIEFIDEERNDMSKVRFGQEYMGLFVEELRQFFPDQLIKDCMTAKRTGIRPNRNYFLGVDIARMGRDESTFEVIELDRNHRLVHKENQITTRTKLNETTKHIIELNKAWNFKKIYIDDEGIGIGVFDDLMDEISTRRKVIGINNSKRVIDKKQNKTKRLLKEDLYNNLLRLMENAMIQLLEDPEIFLSLKSVQFEYTKDTLGRAQLKIFGNYTHIVEGLIRAAWCVKEKLLNMSVHYIKV